jgi:glycosyltransferase involved in cell wall biosynthesis
LEEVLSFDTINFFQNNTLPYLIFVGRLTKVKKLDLLIEALAKINKYCYKVNLLIVGEGEMKEQLKNQVDNISLNSQVKFFGACFEEKQLATLLYRAELCVSPGNVGLTAIHSLSFGTPVCTHGNLNNQMPEVEAIVDGKTGVFFEENSVASLVVKIESWLDLGVRRKTIRKNCFRVIDDFYNPDNQVSVIVKLFNNEPK